MTMLMAVRPHAVRQPDRKTGHEILAVVLKIHNMMSGCSEAEQVN